MAPGQVAASSSRSVAGSKRGGQDDARWTHVLPTASKATIVDATDDADSRLQFFTDALVAGVELRLLVDGVGELPIKTSLDRHLTTLALEFNSVRKDLPLKQIRQVCTSRTEEAPPCHAKPSSGGHAFEGSAKRPGTARGVWLARLELDDDRFCSFSFDGTDQGLLEADMFCVCIRTLVEIARFEQAKLDLQELAQQVAVQKAALEVDAAPEGPELGTSGREEAASYVKDTPSARSIASAPQQGGGVLAEETSRERLLSRLLAAAALMDKNASASLG